MNKIFHYFNSTGQQFQKEGIFYLSDVMLQDTKVKA